MTNAGILTVQNSSRNGLKTRKGTRTLESTNYPLLLLVSDVGMYSALATLRESIADQENSAQYLPWPLGRHGQSMDHDCFDPGSVQHCQSHGPAWERDKSNSRVHDWFSEVREHMSFSQNLRFQLTSVWDTGAVGRSRSNAFLFRTLGECLRS